MLINVIIGNIYKLHKMYEMLWVYKIYSKHVLDVLNITGSSDARSPLKASISTERLTGINNCAPSCSLSVPNTQKYKFPSRLY
jgi:hypothetical protein